MTSKRVFFFFEREYLRKELNDAVFILFQAKLGFVFQHWRKPRNQNMSNTPDPSISGKRKNIILSSTKQQRRVNYKM